MIGSFWRDANGKEFTIKFVDHNMNGSWVHYTDQEGREYDCLVEAFKTRFTPVENIRR